MTSAISLNNHISQDLIYFFIFLTGMWWCICKKSAGATKTESSSCFKTSSGCVDPKLSQWLKLTYGLLCLPTWPRKVEKKENRCLIQPKFSCVLPLTIHLSTGVHQLFSSLGLSAPSESLLECFCYADLTMG